MSSNDLFDLLGIAPSTKATAPEILTEDTDSEAIERLPPGNSCYVLDKWELEKGVEMLKSRTLDNSLTGADLFASVFRQDPALQQECSNELFFKWMQATLDSQEFHVLRQSTVGNVLAAELASEQLATEFKRFAEQQEQSQESGSNKPRAQGSKGGFRTAELACYSAVSNALKAAQQEVDQLEQMQQACGAGVGAGSGGQVDQEQVKRTFKRIKDSYKLKEILERAGRFRRAAQAKQRQKVLHGYDDVVGVEQAGDIARLLPVELAKLGDEDLELDIMRRIVEKQAMCREYRGVEKQGKGPIVVCVDESASMEGDRIVNAKAFALAMYWIARHQNRWCWLVSFGDYDDPFAGVMIPPGSDMSKHVLDWLNHMFGGGTHMKVPLHTIPSMWGACPKGKTDMIIITDADVSVEVGMESIFRKFKEEQKVKLTTIVIDGNGASMRKVSDELFNVNGIEVDSDAVQKCMSI